MRVRRMQASVPDPGECRDAGDVGKVRHDPEQDLWYECIFEPRKRVYTWVILPPVDAPEERLGRNA